MTKCWSCFVKSLQDSLGKQANVFLLFETDSLFLVANKVAFFLFVCLGYYGVLFLVVGCFLLFLDCNLCLKFFPM